VSWAVRYCLAAATILLVAHSAPAYAESSAEVINPLKLSMFVDAYAAWQTNGVGTLAALSQHRAFSGQGSNRRSENGLSLAFLGLDAEYDAGSYGAVVNLRFGPAATLFHGESDLGVGVDLLTQAYALYRPVPEVELDLGMFLSPFGYESLESWKNPNYTIGALYVYGQPNWHTGLKATWQLDDSFSLMALVVNGVNNISETQQLDGLTQEPTVGGSVSYERGSALSFALGGMVALDPAHNDDAGFDGFADFVGRLELGTFSVALNVDYIFTKDGAPDASDGHFIGFSLTGGLRLNDRFGIAARGECLRDDADYAGKDVWYLWTGTLTLDVQPISGDRHLIVRWENRWERSNQRVFGKRSQGTRDTEDDTYRRSWFESVLGVVVTTNP
jgi:Putative beta-barrel porin-2, OmpL-like. bbp2